jgi:hypothetical protein
MYHRRVPEAVMVTFVEARLGTFFAVQPRNNAQQGRSSSPFFLGRPDSRSRFLHIYVFLLITQEMVSSPFLEPSVLVRSLVLADRV